MEQIIGINNGNFALFTINETQHASKKGRNVGNKIKYTYVSDVDNINNYKDVPIDSSIIKSLNVEDYELTLPKVDPSVFRFGKYKGTKILNCTDFQYLTWYYPNITDVSIREKVLGLISDEYFYRDNKFYKKDIKYSENASELISLLSQNKDVLLKFEKNISSTGEYIDENNIIVKFNDYKPMKFGGMAYGLAGSGDNHYSRLKNKTIHVENYEFSLDESINRYILTVNKFKLVK